MVEKIKVTIHAVEKFRERAESTKSDRSIRGRIERMFEKAVPYEPPVGFRVASLINHKFSATSYYRLGEWVFIVCNDSIVTLYKAGNNLLKRRSLRNLPKKRNRKRRK